MKDRMSRYCLRAASSPSLKVPKVAFSNPPTLVFFSRLQHPAVLRRDRRVVDGHGHGLERTDVAVRSLRSDDAALIGGGAGVMHAAGINRWTAYAEAMVLVSPPLFASAPSNGLEVSGAFVQVEPDGQPPDTRLSVMVALESPSPLTISEPPFQKMPS